MRRFTTPKPATRNISKRDAEYWEKVKKWRAMPKGFMREKLFGELYKQQEKHLRFYAFKFQSPLIRMHPDDALQAANLGFLNALDRWDVQRGSWITCLFIWVRRCVQDTQARESVVYRPHSVAKPYKTYRAQEAFEAREGRTPTAEELGVTQKLWDIWQRDLFFSRQPIESSGPKVESLKLASDVLSAEEQLIAAELQQQLDNLTEKERQTLLERPESDEAGELRSRFNG